MHDVLDKTTAPVLFTHSNARAITPHPRNVPDSILARLPKNGGVVMMTFVPGFVSQAVANYGAQVTAVRDSIAKRFPNDNDAQFKAVAAWRETHPTPIATITDVADHLDHIAKRIGADHVGLGGDMDGIEVTIAGMEDVSTYPALFIELARRGWSQQDLEKLASRNLLRVLKAAEVYAASQRGVAPLENPTFF